MTLTELRYIVAVARDKHFGRAAKRCFVSQPTLSLGIKKLEEELGVSLFERGQREISITPVGLKIIEQAERAIREINAIKDIAKRCKDPLSMPLRIGAIHTIGPYLFPSLLPVIRERLSSLPLLIEENYTANLTDRLHSGILDIAIISLPYEEPGLETLALYDEPFVALLPSTHPLTACKRVSIEAISQETVLLLGAQHCFRDQILEICPECIQSVANNDSLQNTLEGSSLETIRYMVASGIGVTILPATAACAEKYSQRLVSVRHFENIRPQRRVALAWRQGFPRMQAVELIASAIQDCDLTGISMVPIQTEIMEPKRKGVAIATP